MVLGQMDNHMQRNEVGSYLTLYTKCNSKWIDDLDARAKAIKLLEKNVGVNLHDLRFGNRVLDLKPKAQGTTEGKLDFIKI